MDLYLLFFTVGSSYARLTANHTARIYQHAPSAPMHSKCFNSHGLFKLCTAKRKKNMSVCRNAPSARSSAR